MSKQRQTREAATGTAKEKMAEYLPSVEEIQTEFSHATEVTGVERETQMEKTLYAVDELTGLIAAVALVRPSKDIRGVKLKSVKKKWKMKAFAPGVNREEVEAGAEALGIPLDEHIQRVLEGMQVAAVQLGLDGAAAN